MKKLISGFCSRYRSLRNWQKAVVNLLVWTVFFVQWVLWMCDLGDLLHKMGF